MREISMKEIYKAELDAKIIELSEVRKDWDAETNRHHLSLLERNVALEIIASLIQTTTDGALNIVRERIAKGRTEVCEDAHPEYYECDEGNYSRTDETNNKKED